MSAAVSQVVPVLLLCVYMAICAATDLYRTMLPFVELKTLGCLCEFLDTTNIINEREDDLFVFGTGVAYSST